MRIKYNAPTVLTFTLLSAVILVLSATIFPNLTSTWFIVPGKTDFNVRNFNHWVSIITHTLGHANLTHFISNAMLLLIIGPMLEEFYGSKRLLLMMAITALVTGILNVLLFNHYLLGASGIVFMMILLSSFTNFSHGEIPLTFILVLILYMGIQLIESLSEDNISQFAHIAGGLCGSFFGFFKAPRS